MPVDACLYFYECTRCAVLLKPKAGDCCIFCSYGTVKCPPKQAGGRRLRLWCVRRRRAQRPMAEEPFRLPANISMHKEMLPDGTAYVLRHREMGVLGRIRIKELGVGGRLLVG